jgi:hypothetical protein
MDCRGNFMGKSKSLAKADRIEQAILLIRGHKVIVDQDLASFYGVTTKRLNEQVKRNSDRFPNDFMFRLSPEEFSNLKSQSATSSSSWGGRRSLPSVFTEHGAIMAASVLNSPKAIEMSILVVRAFVKLRHILASHKHLATKLSELERKVSGHDQSIRAIFEAIRQLIEKPVPKKRRIGFGAKDGK